MRNRKPPELAQQGAQAKLWKGFSDAIIPQQPALHSPCMNGR